MALGRHLERASHLADAPKHKRRGGNFLQHVDVEDFLQSLEVESLSRSTSDEFNFSCPFPGHTSGDMRPSAYMNDGSKDASKATVWKCHGCARSGNGVTFLAEMEGISKSEASNFIKQTWAPGFRAPKGGSIGAEFELRLWEKQEKRKSAVIDTLDWDDYHERFGVDWYDAHEQYLAPDCPSEVAYMFSRGFDALTLRFWNIGYDDISGRIAIPVANVDGELVGIKGRAWSDDVRPKYRILGDKENRRPRYHFMPYEKSLQIYGLETVADHKRVVLDEGELNVMAWWQMGIPAISTGSAHLSEQQARLVRDSDIEELVVCFDNNEAGDNATWGYTNEDGEWHPGLVESLGPHLRLLIVDEHDNDAAKLLELARVSEAEALVEGAKPHHRILT